MTKAIGKNANISFKEIKLEPVSIKETNNNYPLEEIRNAIIKNNYKYCKKIFGIKYALILIYQFFKMKLKLQKLIQKKILQIRGGL